MNFINDSRSLLKQTQWIHFVHGMLNGIMFI